MSGYTVVGIQAWEVWKEANEPTVQLLQLRMKQQGIDMTAEEAYAYMCWCHSNVTDAIFANVDMTTAGVIRHIMGVISDGCAQNYKQHKLGKLLPPKPGTVYFASPEAFAKAMKPSVSTEMDERIEFAHKHGGGYL